MAPIIIIIESSKWQTNERRRIGQSDLLLSPSQSIGASGQRDAAAAAVDDDESVKGSGTGAARGTNALKCNLLSLGLELELAWRKTPVAAIGANRGPSARQLSSSLRRSLWPELAVWPIRSTGSRCARRPTRQACRTPVRSRPRAHRKARATPTRSQDATGGSAGATGEDSCKLRARSASLAAADEQLLISSGAASDSRQVGWPAIEPTG